MENTDSLLNTAKEIMTRQLLVKPVLRSDSKSEKQLKKLFHHNCIEMDVSAALSLADKINSDYLNTKFPNKTLPLFQKARKYGSSET
jgi:hypothetical protein